MSCRLASCTTRRGPCLDPDEQVRETIAYFFETFARVGSAHQTVKAFRDEGLRFPSRLRAPATGVIFHPLNASAAMRTLRNPRYAGAYAYGQRVYGRTVDGKKTIRARATSDWTACIPNAHPGYITWERYQENLRLLASNGHGYDAARASPPREGVALLQGRAVCGRCGQHMRVRYRDARGRLESWYVCDRRTDARAEPNCQSLAGGPIDEAIGLLVVEKMTPAAVELALEIRREIEARYDEADQLRCRAVERAQIEADLAQRRFMMVDPGNRLVADTLEADWNEKLRELAKARDERERARREDRIVIDDATRERLVAMTTDFKGLWSAPSTPNRERKRMLAYVIEDATLVKLPGERTTKVHVRFKGGQTTTLTTTNPRASWEKVKTPTEIVELVDKLLDDHLYDRDRRDPRRTGASSRWLGVARERRRAIHGAPSAVHRAYLWPAPAARSSASPRAAHQDGTRRSPRDPRVHSHELGQAWHHQGACVQWPRLPLRGAAESAHEALQPMGSTHGQSPDSAGITATRTKTPGSDRRRCSVKTAGCRKHTCRCRRKTEP